MAVEIMTSEKGAVFFCNTQGRAFGPVMEHPRSNIENLHRDVARKVLEKVEEERGDIRSVDLEYIDSVYNYVYKNWDEVKNRDDFNI